MLCMAQKKKTEDLKTQFGRRLQTLRKSAGLTQDELALRTGLTVESISKIERGLQGPRFDSLELIADALSLSVVELFSFT